MLNPYRFWPQKATQSTVADPVQISKEILSYGIGE